MMKVSSGGLASGGDGHDPPPDPEFIQRMLRSCAEKGRVDWSSSRADTSSKKEPAAAADIVVEDDDDEPDRDALGAAVSKICFGKVWCATLLLVKIWAACANSDIEQYIFLRPRQGPQANSDIEQYTLLMPRQGPQVFFSFVHITRQFFHYSKTIPW